MQLATVAISDYDDFGQLKRNNVEPEKLDYVMRRARFAGCARATATWIHGLDD